MFIRVSVVFSAYVHGDVPGHVDMGLKLIHPDFSGSQGVPLGVVVDVVVVGLLGAFDVSDSGTGQDLHAAPALPHLRTHTHKIYTHEIFCSGFKICPKYRNSAG